MEFLGIIPARYASTRFPGKPLADIAGKPMIRRVYERARSALRDVWVATDDARIEQAVREFGGEVVLTSETCSSGTERCMEAAERIAAETGRAWDVVINVQGDEPLLQGEMLARLKAAFRDPAADIATLVNPVVDPEDIHNASEVKVVFTRNRDALYFSRSPIPYLMEVDPNAWISRHTFYKHVGVYAYRLEALREITALPPSTLETAERLEQNRWLEAGFRIKVEITDLESVPVDTPADLERVRRLLERQGP